MTTVAIPIPKGQIDLLDSAVQLREQARGCWQTIQEAGRYASPNPAEARLAEQRIHSANEFFEQHPEMLKEMQKHG
jgi:hypothetical protein